MKNLITKILFSSTMAGMFFFTIVSMSDASEKHPISYDNIFTIEYLAPVKESRDIRTINIDCNWFITHFEKVNLSIYAGLAATYATGSITQLEGRIESGTLREVHYDNTAFGLGPGLLARFRIWNSKKFSIHLNGSGNIFFYNKEFPAGGDYYNFMWRAGPSFEYKIDKSKVISFGYHWAHVSNGQGLSAKNPAYDAEGLVLRFSGFF